MTTLYTRTFDLKDSLYKTILTIVSALIVVVMATSVHGAEKDIFQPKAETLRQLLDDGYAVVGFLDTGHSAPPYVLVLQRDNKIAFCEIHPTRSGGKTEYYSSQTCFGN